MLSELYRNPAIYDMVFPGPRHSGLFLAAQAQRIGDPILELACGTGILALPLAQRGFDVTGLDFAPEMLEHARAKAAALGSAARSVVWVEGDMRDFTLDRHFQLIVLIHNSMAHLHSLEDIQACLASVRRHLAPEGRFIVNAATPDLQMLNNHPRDRHPFGRYRDAETGQDFIVFRENTYDPVRQINTLRIFRQTPGTPPEALGELPLWIYFPQEFDALLQWSGFTIERKLGNYEGAPFGVGPDAALLTQLCICAARA